VVCVFIARSITGSITRCINLTTEYIDKTRTGGITILYDAVLAMEQGDLTKEVSRGTWLLDFGTNDEFAKLAKSYNELLHMFRETIDSFGRSKKTFSYLIRSIQEDANRVTSASTSLASTAENVASGSAEIGSSMREVSRASEQSARGAVEVAQGGASQAQSLAHGNELVKELVTAVNSVARDAETATQASDKAKAAAAGGAEAVNQTIAGMNRIQQTVDNAAEVVRTLGSASAQIGAIVGTIEDIADQTNLLALNAAIEAARAGEAGRGFAVVADEVRKLAERSRGATQEIGSLIATVQSQTEQAVAAMESGTHEVEAGAELAGQAGAALSEIQSVVVEVTAQVGNICAAAAEMLKSSQEVAGAISEVAAIVEESSAAAEEMSASSEQVSASISGVAETVDSQHRAVDELVASSKTLSSVAESLESATSRFRIEVKDELSDSHPTRHLAKAA
jgi:methyl-accepting chemotaxis protein